MRNFDSNSNCTISFEIPIDNVTGIKSYNDKETIDSCATLELDMVMVTGFRMSPKIKSPTITDARRARRRSIRTRR